MGEENTTVVTETQETTQNNNETADVQALRLELAKTKKAMDKAAAEAANYKRQLSERLTADEKAAAEKAEQDAIREQEYQELKRENSINKIVKQFMGLGYDAVQAEKAATAQYDGDMETMFSVQKEVQTALLKAKEAEWINSRPPIQSGVGENSSISKEQFEKMGYSERVQLKQKNPELYKILSQ